MPAMPEIQETWVRFPGQEYPLEKDMATNSSIFARKIPSRRAWQAAVHGFSKSRHD